MKSKIKATALICNVQGDRIQIECPNEKDYKEFNRILKNIHREGLTTWFGDINDNIGNEISGLVITSKHGK